jgi:hypothetical protein
LNRSVEATTSPAAGGIDDMPVKTKTKPQVLRERVPLRCTRNIHSRAAGKDIENDANGQTTPRHKTLRQVMICSKNTRQVV